MFLWVDNMPLILSHPSLCMESNAVENSINIRFLDF